MNAQEEASGRGHDAPETPLPERLAQQPGVRLQSETNGPHPNGEARSAAPPPTAGACIQDPFLDWAARAPKQLAIAGESSRWTYSELAQASAALGRELIRQAQPQGCRSVALVARRTPSLVVAILACLQAQRPFIVLDASYPPARIQNILQGLPAPLVLGLDLPESELHHLLAGRIPPERMRVLAESDLHALRHPRNASTHSSLAPLSPLGSTDAQAPHEVAYYLQTSGTTGAPKCIQNTHGPLLHFIHWYVGQFDVQPNTRFALLSGLSHDPVLRDIFVPLSTGGVVCIPEQARLLAPNDLFSWLSIERVAFLHATPQLLDLIAAGALGASLNALRWVFSGGDALRMRTVSALQGLAPQARVVNFYGTSETPQAMCFHEVDPVREHDPIPIGRGIEGVQILVLDDEGQPVPPGTTGQLVVQTPHLALGYVNATPSDAARFQSVQAAGARRYETGDRAWVRADGALVLAGRSDDQVKIRGFRVELAEVSHALRQIEGVADALSLSAPLPSGEQRLSAFLIRKPGAPAVRDTDLQQQMRALLPSYMVPSRCVWLDRFPLMANSKIDRLRLLDDLQQADLAQAAQGRSPQGDAEQQLAFEWQRILGIAAFDTQLSFSEIGGDSLSFIEAAVAVENALGHLPDQWDEIPFFALFATEAVPTGTGSSVEMVDFIRALAIVLIVLSHSHLLFDLIDPVQGALGLEITKSDMMWLPWSSYPLFVLAGYSFGRFQLPYLLRLGDGRPLLNTMAAIALPTVLFTAILQWKASAWYLPSLLLIDNFFPPPGTTFASFWFIEVLVQCQLLLCLALCVPRLRQGLSQHRFAVPLGAMALSFGLSLLLPWVWNTSALYDRVPHKLIWLLFMGWSLAAAQSRHQYLLVAAVSALSALVYALNFDARFIFFCVFAMLLIRHSPRIRLPRPISQVFTRIAKNTLFIYLVHAPLLAMLDFRLGAQHEGLKVGLALAAGIVFGKTWRWTSQQLSARRQQVHPTAELSGFCNLGPYRPEDPVSPAPRF